MIIRKSGGYLTYGYGTPRLISLFLLLRTCMLVLGKRHHMHIAPLLILRPEDVVRHLRLRIKFHAFKDMLYKLLVAHPVNEVSAVEILRLVIQAHAENFCQLENMPRITSSVTQFRNSFPALGFCLPVLPPRVTR